MRKDFGGFGARNVLLHVRRAEIQPCLDATGVDFYGAPEGLQFGFPVRSDGTSWQVVEGIEHDDFAQEKIAVTTKELVEERDEVRALGLIG